ncbi:hypothetical protein [Jiulongibacter sediminis]|uniref:Uncharacterized protein n=1 Tax=Jiulongibacter sediminis TaxID=1605367 RepID=A0A0P7BIR0_9BACT|nr:hypothetical protein [Jiulongibacter sediminis]KPM47017.1 hypothetical protein AFM12_17470 [Jiulongibacter sediminis]TBX22359.1 hypothetical protein TK44_17475 [Jiulongibacter sediminis]
MKKKTLTSVSFLLLPILSLAAPIGTHRPDGCPECGFDYTGIAIGVVVGIIVGYLVGKRK